MGKKSTVNDLHIYDDLLKKLYAGEYRCGDKLPATRELCVLYGVGIGTVSSAIKRLRDEELVKTESRNGTVVLFDLSNPAHLGIATAHRPEFDENEMNTLQIPGLLISSMSCACVKNASTAERGQLIIETNTLIYNLQKGFPCGKLTRVFFTNLIALSGNSFLIEISRDLSRGFVLFVPPEELDTQAEKRQRTISILFFTNLRKLLISGDYPAVRSLVKAFYEALYRIPNVFLFSNAGHDSLSTRQKTLYDQLVRQISRDIVFDKLQMGDSLPTQKELCARFHVSKNTVLHAYEILKEQGLVESRYRGGTVVIVDVRGAEFQQKLDKHLYELAKETANALQALWTIARDICVEAAKYINCEIVTEMGTRLENQRKCANLVNSPMSVFDALLTPLVLSLKNGRLSKYYFYLMEPVLDFIGLYTLRTRNFDGWCSTVYDAGQLAVEALRERDVDRFWDQFKQAARCNTRLFSALGDELINDVEQWDIDPKCRGN